MKVMMKTLPINIELPVVREGYVMDEETTRDFLACNDRSDLKKLLAKLKQKTLNDPDIITLVEFDPFYGYESETVVAHLTKLKDIATMFTKDERTRYFYILKIFPFSLKGDAKIWFNSLDPGCVRSPQDMLYYFSAKYFPA